MASDSTCAIIALWRLCVPVGLGPQVGGDGAIPVDVLKVVLERELLGHLDDFGQSSVDEILQTYMQPDSEGVVGFLQFWKGMEEILRARGTLRSTLTRAQEEAIIGFRFLRTCLLDMAARQVSQGRSSFSVKELRYFIGRTTALTGAEGEAFWRRQARQLPEDPEMLVTGEEVASAMLTWLEQLVDEGLSGEGEDDEDSGDEEEEPEVGIERVALPPPPSLSPSPSADRLAPDRPLAIAAPTGPPPKRQVQARLSRPSLSFQSGLTALLDKGEAWPSQATKETAAEWREVIAFQVSIKRWLLEMKHEEVDLVKFHQFARTYFSKGSRPSGRSSPRNHEPRLSRAALALKAVLQNVSSKRLAEGVTREARMADVASEDVVEPC
ncbi:Ube3c [Symbiodinium natans]|uniref:Ube3c protein n=1 Tax=Symbiodinium natans TaxID=878477 RepID=A0A812U8L7_9DINO|nr:Ube3c [Symbiodinium natans]